MANNQNFKVKNGLNVAEEATIVGNLTAKGLLYPTADGSDKQVLTTDGSGNITLQTPSTTNITEGTNLFYTDTRARESIAVTDAGGDGSLTYDDSTGVITYTGPSAAEVRAHISHVDAGGDGSLSYDSSTGVITYTGPSATEVRAHISHVDAGGDGSLSYDSSTGVITYTGPSATEVRAHISHVDNGGDGSLSYDSSTGVITYTGPSATEARAHISVTDAGGDGSASYDAATGVITYTGPSAAEVRAHHTGGTGVTITAGEVAIGQSVGTTDEVTFAEVHTTRLVDAGGTITIDPTDNGANTGDVIIAGNLTINGTTTTVDSNDVNIGDSIVVLNANEAGTPSQNAGIEIERGTATNKTLLWDETNDNWTVGAETFVAATFEGNVTGDLTGNADTADTLKTARDIALAGDVTGTASFDGSANITITTTIDGSAHDHTSTDITDFEEAVEDVMGTAIVGGNAITATYDDTAGTITIDHTDTSSVTLATALTAGNVLTGVTFDTYGHAQSVSSTDLDGRYYTEAELDAGQLDNQYYTETELDAGQLDNRYYTETELDAGQLDDRYYTETELDAGQLDTRYYTEAELDAGQLDNRYYTETEADANFVDVTGDTMTGTLTIDDGATLVIKSPDSSKTLTAQVFDSGGAYIATSSTDSLNFTTRTTVARTPGSNNAYFMASSTGSTLLFHNGTEKLQTTATGLDISGNIALDGTVDGRDVATDGTKLDGIEALADVTDTVNVTAAGALMDSEVTNLAQVKAFDSSDYATAAQGTLADNALPITGGTVTGTVAATAFTGPLTGDVTGNADTATALATARNIALTGDVTGTASFDGTSDISITTTVDTAEHNHDDRYYTETELDAGQLDNRYYTETELDAGQLDTRYYTETELDAGQLDNQYYTETELDAGQLDDRYYTETELDAGQLDNRYYTETEADTKFVDVTGDTMSGNLLFNDSTNIVMDSALTIGHDTASYITSTTPLTVKTDTFNVVSNTGTENMITAGVDGAVNLYHDNVLRLATDAQGVNITDDLDVAGNIAVTGTVDGRDVATDGTKLDTIETNADVTDTTNVTAAGALMDSEVTNLAQVKAFDSSDYEPADTTILKDADIGVNVQAYDANIVSDATYVKTDENFTTADHSKLDGIELLADVTDTDNVVAALTAGTNITISAGGEIASSFTNTTYTAGDGIALTGTAFSVSAGTGLTQTATGLEHADTSSLSGAYGQTSTEDGTYIKSVTVDANGHLTAVTTDDFDDRYDMYTSWNIAANGTVGSSAITAGNTVTFTGTGGTSVTRSGDNITINTTEITNNNQLTNGAGYVTTDTTYTAGNGLQLSGTEFSVTAVALTTVQTAASEVAQLALTAQEGDVVVRSDENKTYMHNGGSAGTMADYTVLATPTDTVLSVDGQTGAVTLNHDSLTGYVANEHIDWTADSAGTIHASNYTNTTYTIADGQLSQNNFTNALKLKLDNIEATADITDTANVTAAGALMDSEVTNLDQVKAFDETDYVAVTGDTMTGDLNFGNNNKVNVGTSNALQLYHTGLHSLIYNNAGNLYFYQATNDGNIHFQSDDSTGGTTDYIVAEGSTGEVQLSHYGSTKLATKTGGVDITGDITVSGNVDGVDVAQLRLDVDNLNTEVVDDTTPQLGGNLDVNGNDITSAGNLTLDAGGDIYLNADGADIILADDTVEFGRFKRDNGDFVIKAETQDKDLLFKGVTGGATFTALTLDMSDSGLATFNSDIAVAGNNIVLNSAVTGTPSANAGIEVERGTSTNVTFVWNETDDAWDLNNETLQNVVIDGGSY